MKATPPLPPAIAAIHRALGIPADYAAARGLPFQPEAREAELVEIALNPDGRPVRVTPSTAAAWEGLRLCAARDGVELLAISGFRSVARQTEILRGKLASGQPLASILRLVAAPGFSEHHTGRALDLGCAGHTDLEEDFAATAAFHWLNIHAARHGFRLSYPHDNAFGIGFEPWHWLFGADK